MKIIKRKFSSVLKTLSDIKHEQGIQKILPYVYHRALYYIACSVKFILTLPIALILIALRPFKEINLIMLLSSRIGHFSANTEFMLLSQYKEMYSKNKLYLFYEEKMVCNTQLSKMWKRVLPVLPFPRICREVDKTLATLLGEKYKNNPVKAFESCLLGRDHHQWLETRDIPYIYFTPKEVADAEAKLATAGWKKGMPIVCLLVRDAGYLNHRAPGKNLYQHHDCRNADVTNYRKAALFLAEKGYMVFRMGKHVEKPFNVDHPNVIDYANHLIQCDLLDIYLTAHCNFIISTSTGLDCITQLFRKPLLFTDILPIYGQLQTWYPCMMYITKKIRNRDTHALLTFKELEKEFTGIIDVAIQDTLTNKNAEIIPNTEDEILEAVIEMESKIKNTWIDTEENKQLQKKILTASFPSTLMNEQFRFSLEKIKISIGNKFMRENSALFTTEE